MIVVRQPIPHCESLWNEGNPTNFALRRFLCYFLAAKSGIKKLIVISIGKAVSTKVDANHLRMQTYVVSTKP